MKTAAIICEYNPFHQGHQYQLRALRQRLGEDTAVLCLMSGNYVQRGEPAVYDKWRRAGEAVTGGADLVLELPMTIAVNAAGYFAAGAVDCLEALGGVDVLCFGSENGDLEELASAARILGSPEYDMELGQQLRTGVSFAVAREAALRHLGGSGQCLSAPNSALGVDYLRRLMELDSGIQPLVIPRESQYPSASALRTAMARDGAEIHSLRHGERAMLALLRTLPDWAFEEMPFGSEGLWSKVMKECRRGNTLEEILFACKSKRYAMSRLRRMLLCLFLGLSGEDLNKKPPYLRVLAFDGRGRELLHALKKTSSLPLISGTLPDTPEALAYLEMESRATDLYGLFAPPGITEPTGRERRERPVILL